MFHSPEAVLFDLDGTLVDSAADLCEAANVLLAELGLRPVDLAETRSMVGDGVATLVRKAVTLTGGDPSDLAPLVARYMAIYEPNAARLTRAYPGVHETLEGLQQAGVKMGVVTNKPRAATLAILGALDLERFFGVVVGGDTLPQRKPSPQPLLAALATLGVPPGQAIMVGDNFHDVEAAHAAGMPAVIVTYGYSHRPHAELGADRLIPDMAQLRFSGIL